MNRPSSTQTVAPPRAPWLLVVGDRKTEVEASEDLASALLDPARRSGAANEIATLVAPSGASISVGIAGPDDDDNPGLDTPLASVEFDRNSPDPPYLVVVGDPSLDYETGGVAVFRFGGQWTEILRRNCVPIDVMARIVGEIATTGEPPSWIGWEEV